LETRPNFYIEQTLTALARSAHGAGAVYEKRVAEKFSRASKTFRRSCARAENLDEPPAPLQPSRPESRQHSQPPGPMASALVDCHSEKQQRVNAANDGAADALEKFSSSQGHARASATNARVVTRISFAQRGDDAVHA